MSAKIKSYTFHSEAYSIAVYHTAKHSGSTCSGLLLGRVENSNSVVFSKAVPITHTHALSPPLKLACIAAETLAKKEGLEILGYYCANNLQDKMDLNPLHRNVFDKFVQVNPISTCWILDARKVFDEELAFKGHTLAKNELHPIAEGNVSLIKPEALGNLKKRMCNLEYLKVMDFDDHLHDPTKDWTNQELSEQIALAA